MQGRSIVVAIEQAAAAHLLIDGDVLFFPQLAYRLPYGTLAFEGRNIAELLDYADTELFVGLRCLQFELRQCIVGKSLPVGSMLTDKEVAQHPDNGIFMF